MGKYLHPTALATSAILPIDPGTHSPPSAALIIRIHLATHASAFVPLGHATEWPFFADVASL